MRNYINLLLGQLIPESAQLVRHVTLQSLLLRYDPFFLGQSRLFRDTMVAQEQAQGWPHVT